MIKRLAYRPAVEDILRIHVGAFDVEDFIVEEVGRDFAVLTNCLDFELHINVPRSTMVPGMSGAGMAETLVECYPDADLDELENLAQTAIPEYGGTDADYDECCRELARMKEVSNA